MIERRVPVSPVRSRIMRAVGSRDTGPEWQLRRALWRSGLRYRVQLRIAGTRPDLAFPGKRVAIFVDGCFWHRCPLHYREPKQNADFWRAKIGRNQERDVRDRLRLETAGWTVLRFWQCEISADLAGVVERVGTALRFR